jgi:hypothetical protein
MKKLMIACALFVMVPVTVAAQGNPCVDIAVGDTVINPTKLYISAPEFGVKEADGTERIADFQISYFAQGTPVTGTPVQGPSTLPKSTFALVAGTVDCYAAPNVPSIPSSLKLVAHVRARRAASTSFAEAFGEWSDATNPFGLAPAAPAKLKVSRVGK